MPFLASMLHQVFMHIDFNSYFASCHQQDDLSLRGIPVGICEHLGGIIISPSVEAKRWGIKTAMPVWEARKLYPQIKLLYTDAEKYRHYHKKFIKLLADYAKPDVFSIDEAFLDVSKLVNIKVKNAAEQWVPAEPYAQARLLAREIKFRLQNEVGDWLRVSIGIGPSKLVAKIASDMQKPNGLVVVPPQDVAKLYEKLDLIDVPGIGRRMKKRLHSMGIYKLSDLRDYSEDELIRRFGVPGKHLSDMGKLQGSSLARVDGVQSSDMKSMGHMYTLPHEYRHVKHLDAVLLQLCEMVAKRLRAKQFVATTLFVYVRIEGNSFKQSKKLGYSTDSGSDFFYECRLMLAGSFGTVLEAVGVTAGGLLSGEFKEIMLFPEMQKKQNLNAARDKINNKYGTGSLQSATERKGSGAFRDSVGFGRVREID